MVSTTREGRRRLPSGAVAVATTPTNRSARRRYPPPPPPRVSLLERGHDALPLLLLGTTIFFVEKERERERVVLFFFTFCVVGKNKKK